MRDASRIDDVARTRYRLEPHPVPGDLGAWQATPVWTDAESCRVSMKRLPHGGSTFEDAQISDAGRRLLADRLTKLTATDLETLFAEARFPGDISAWVTTFRRKVDEIAARPPCPPRASAGASAREPSPNALEVPDTG